jgi:hypothetical protein
MLKVCLVSSSMRLGVPFIVQRQLGAVESSPGRQFWPSVDWCTGQSGAPPDTVRCGFLFLFWRSRPLKVWSRWRTGHSGAPFRPLAWPSVTRGLRGRPLAHRTVRCTLDSPVNFSRTPPTKSRERPFYQSQPGAPDSPVHPD